MKSILAVHLSALYVSPEMLQEAADAKATAMTHLFFAGVYAFPMIGALLADRFAGKYNTILWLSLVYCAGHGVLAVGESSLSGTGFGLALIAVGSGGIKPCVSAHVGDQFGRGNWFRVKTVFQAFYFIVNFGSFFATLFIPLIDEYFGRTVAFGLPGGLMLLATVAFWAGRNEFIHVQANPGGKVGVLDTLCAVSFFLSFGHLFVTAAILHLHPLVMVGCSVAFVAIGLALFALRQRVSADDGFLAVTLHTIRQNLSRRKSDDTKTGGDDDSHPLFASSFWRPALRRYGGEATEGPVAVLKLISVFILVSVFWALFEQHSSTWIFQARSMNLQFLGMTLLPTQIGALNPLMVMILIPTMNVVYSFSKRLGYELTPLRRMTGGMVITGFSFVSIAIIQEWIDGQGEGVVSVGWQVVPYVFLTIGEVMVSITGLEFAYTQAPKRMKSTLMGFWYLSISLGQVLVALLAGVEALEAAASFWTYSGLMFGAAVLFGIRARFYKAKDYTQ
jgi:POT family proton-dependent oligopeptide transporter